jgi:hypothetical protein
MTMVVRRVDLSALAPSVVLSPRAQTLVRMRAGAPTAQAAIMQVQAGMPEALIHKIRRLSADQMWGLDKTWAGASSRVDGRLCLSRPPVAYKPSTCGGDPVCNWAFLSVEKTCDAETFSNVMFQGVRYVWCQAKLAELLDNKPIAPKTRSRASANEWADWCISVMRLVSMANWSSNVHPNYLVPLHERPNAKAAAADIKSFLRNEPTKAHPRDQIATQDAFTMLMAAPAVIGIKPVGSYRIPTKASDFNPGWVARAEKLTRDKRPWPWERFGGRSPIASGSGRVGSSRVRDALVAWFEQSLTGTGGDGYWYVGRQVLATTMGTQGCGFGPSGICSRELGGRQHWWGSADAQIRMCEAWAQDIIDTSFGQLVSTSIQEFLDRYAAIPDHLRALTNAQIGEVRDALSERVMNEITAGIGTGIGVVASVVNVVPVIGQIASAAIAIVGALVVGLLQILQAAGAMAYGGGDVEAACLAPPVIRQIPYVGTEACNLDPRDGRVSDVATQITAVAAAASRDLPVNIWFQSSGAAAGEEGMLTTPDDDLVRDDDGGADEGGVNPLLVIGGLGVLGLLGYAAFRGKE